MCDFSLHSVKSRPAKVGDKLTTRDFGTGTRGFAATPKRPLQFNGQIAETKRVQESPPVRGSDEFTEPTAATGNRCDQSRTCLGTYRARVLRADPLGAADLL
jgi:hypothetical protein